MPLRIRIFPAVAASLLALPMTAATITGFVFDDTRALANRADFTPLSGVTIHVYRDGGDATADGKDDTAAGDAVTATNGAYSVTVPAAGLFWVAVDSHSIKPSPAWAEQTFGPIGALCADSSGAAAPPPPRSDEGVAAPLSNVTRMHAAAG